MSDDQDIGELKAKLEAQAAEFQSYKQECKHLEQILEEQCQKKQTEIKQLKEDAIKKQKGQKMLKTQFSQLQAEIANLKTQLTDSNNAGTQATNSKQQLDKLNDENTFLKSSIAQFEAKLQQTSLAATQLLAERNQARSKTETLKNALQQSEQKAKSQVSQPSQSFGKEASKTTEQQMKKLRQKLGQVQKEKSKLQKSLKDKQLQLQKWKHQAQDKVKKSSKPQEQKQLKRQHSEPKQLKQSIPLSQHKHQMSKLNQTVHQLQQRLKQLQHTDKDQKVKLTQVMNDKTALLQKYKKIAQQLQRQKEKREHSYNESPQKTPSQQIMIDDGYNHGPKDIPSVRMDSVLLTKKHYISPFIEVKDNRLIKLYKSTKNGFEKSLGATRHKFDSVGYDSDAVVLTAAELAKVTIEQGQSHSIVVYGSKRTSKKQVLCLIVERLKEWLIEKIDEYQESAEEEDGIRVQFKYVKHSVDAQVHEQKESTNKEQIAQILESILSQSSPSSPSKKSKKSQKPKVRYMSFSFGQSLHLQLITSSYLNPFLKQNQTFVDYLNTIAFSKLPNILQSNNQHYHIITLINPIVSEYEECKNTLSVTMVPFGEQGSEQQPMTSTLVYSPGTINREDLNDLTKKKLESFEKETEQASLKVRKVQEECTYFKNRFEQLQVRLKNLINTHQQQNTYLKKSPVTLSYQKLLKFVNSVLSRNTSVSRQSISPNLGMTSEDHYQNQVNMYIEEDAKSLDGY